MLSEEQKHWGERNGMRGLVYVCQQFIKSNNAVRTATVYLTPCTHIGSCMTADTLDTNHSVCVSSNFLQTKKTEEMEGSSPFF